jgi:hypothetical protein
MVEATSYPGIGADAGIDALHRTVGEITAFWAGVEDSLFTTFFVALTGNWAGDIRPYRAAYFAISSAEGKMRMVDSAMKVRFVDDVVILKEWEELRKSFNKAAELRNKIAHLVPMAQGSADPNAKANVRLVPPFWKGAPARMQARGDFNKQGFSLDELLYEMAAFWGYRPPIMRTDVPEPLAYRLQQFSMKLLPPIPSPQSGS